MYNTGANGNIMATVIRLHCLRNINWEWQEEGGVPAKNRCKYCSLVSICGGLKHENTEPSTVRAVCNLEVRDTEMSPDVRPWGHECPSQKWVWALHDGNVGEETKTKWKKGHWLSYIVLRAEGKKGGLQPVSNDPKRECWDTVSRKKFQKSINNRKCRIKCDDIGPPPMAYHWATHIVSREF